MSQARKIKTPDVSALEKKSAPEVSPHRSSTPSHEARIPRLAPETVANLDLDAAFAALPMSPLPTSLFHRAHAQPAATPKVPAPLAQDSPISRDSLEATEDEYDALTGLFLDEDLLEANLAQAAEDAMGLESNVPSQSLSQGSLQELRGSPNPSVIGIIGPDVVDVSLSDAFPKREESPTLQALNAAAFQNAGQQPSQIPGQLRTQHTPVVQHVTQQVANYKHNATPTNFTGTANQHQVQPAQGVELLILGHLPVIANAWSVQYARHVAETTGQPVALLRLNGESLSLEVVYADTEQALALRAGGPTAHLDDAALRARKVAPRLLIRVDETLELDVIEALTTSTVDNNAVHPSPALTQITVLAGADPLAVLAAYRTIKGLMSGSGPALRTTTEGSGLQTPSNRNYSSSDDSSNSPALSVAIMGSPQEQALEAANRINRAVQTFLGSSLAAPACIQRMDACATSLLYRGPWTRAATLLLDEVADVWSPARTSNAPQVKRTPHQATDLTGHLGRAASGGSSLSQTKGPTPLNPTGSTHPVGQQHSNSPTFAQRLNSELRPLSSRCPYCPGIELASGPDGSLHLIAATPQLGGLCEPNQAVGQLLETAAWADDHAALLASAHPSLAPIKQAPILHVLTDDPRSIRGILNTGVRVHLIACVSVHGQNTWVCQDLN